MCESRRNPSVDPIGVSKGTRQQSIKKAFGSTESAHKNATTSTIRVGRENPPSTEAKFDKQKYA